MNEGSQKLRNHILGLRQLLDGPDLRGLLKETGNMGEQFMQFHNIEGNYLGGAYADRPYSTTTLPLFFFGKISIDENSGDAFLTDTETLTTNLRIPSSEIFWRSKGDGSKMAYLRGGYATWLRYKRPGKNLQKPDHSLTGGMLRNLTFDMTFEHKVATVRWYVRPPHDQKAWWTHRRREWLGLFRSEVDQIARMASEKFGVEVFDMLDPER